MGSFRWHLGTLPPCEELRPWVEVSRGAPFPSQPQHPGHSLSFLPSVFFHFLEDCEEHLTEPPSTLNSKIKWYFVPDVLPSLHTAASGGPTWHRSGLSPQPPQCFPEDRCASALHLDGPLGGLALARSQQPPPWPGFSRCGAGTSPWTAGGKGLLGGLSPRSRQSLRS